MYSSKIINHNYLSHEKQHKIVTIKSINQLQTVCPRTDNIDSLLKSAVSVGSSFVQCTMCFISDYIALECFIIFINLIFYGINQMIHE